jgi:hypothetical protein
MYRATLDFQWGESRKISHLGASNLESLLWTGLQPHSWALIDFQFDLARIMNSIVGWAFSTSALGRNLPVEATIAIIL